MAGFDLVCEAGRYPFAALGLVGLPLHLLVEAAAKNCEQLVYWIIQAEEQSQKLASGQIDSQVLELSCLGALRTVELHLRVFEKGLHFNDLLQPFLILVVTLRRASEKKYTNDA